MVTEKAEVTSLGLLSPIFRPAGDTALVVQFGETVDPVVNRRVRQLANVLDTFRIEGIVDLVPTMRSLMIHRDPLVLSHRVLVGHVQSLIDKAVDFDQTARRWHIPVCYQGQCAPDLEHVARCLEMRTDEVVQRHHETEMEVFMMGFLPGFPYLGLLPEEFDLPRRPEPRIKVPPRSISVAARQTTVYTIESPGGWHLIGRTPVEFYDPKRSDPILVKAGDRIRFEPVPITEYRALRQAVKAGTYSFKKEIIL